MWANLRRLALRTYSSFTNLMKEQVGNCGELIYNFDYQYKYLTKYQKEGESMPTYGDIAMLHGTRISYIEKC